MYKKTALKLPLGQIHVQSLDLKGKITFSNICNFEDALVRRIDTLKWKTSLFFMLFDRKKGIKTDLNLQLGQIQVLKIGKDFCGFKINR